MHTLRYAFYAYNNETYKGTNWTGTSQATWNSLFGVVAPLMINEASEPTLKRAIDRFVKEENHENLAKKKDLKNCNLDRFSLDREDFQTIKVQFRALGLIARSEKTRSVRDVETYWTLTPYGDEVMTRLRAIKRTIVPEEAPVVEKDEEKKEGL